MGIRDAIARCFGRGSRRESESSEWAKEITRLDRKSEAILQAENRHLGDLWSSKIMGPYRAELALGGFIVPEEKVCPLTRQIVLQNLTELAAKYDQVSIRQLIAHATLNGVKDDYEFAERLKELAVDRMSIPMKLVEGAQIQTTYNPRYMAHQVRIRLGNKAADFLVDDLPIG